MSQLTLSDSASSLDMDSVPTTPATPRKRSRRKATSPVAAPDSSPKPTRTKGTKPTPLTRRLSYAVASVATFTLTLSVWHCTEALSLLTGSPVFLALLLAVGIDCGMVCCEASHVLGSPLAARWSARYVTASAVLSAGLNAYASAQHASSLPWLAAIVGASIPGLVFLLARVAGHLYKGE